MSTADLRRATCCGFYGVPRAFGLVGRRRPPSSGLVVSLDRSSTLVPSSQADIIAAGRVTPARARDDAGPTDGHRGPPPVGPAR